jgi:hypothetical protein
MLFRINPNKQLTDWDMIRSMTSCEVAEEAKEKVFPAMAGVSSTSPAGSSAWGGRLRGRFGKPRPAVEERALETSEAEALHERERNSIGSLISVVRHWKISLGSSI